jgi:hypothetical protein
MIIIITLSTKPIAVRIESKEKTASTITICNITAPNAEGTLVFDGLLAISNYDGFPGCF